MQHLLFEFVLRAALIAAGTAAVLRVLRVKMAAARHSAWAGVVVLMLLLPVWTAWGPKASWRVLPAAAAPVSAGRVILPAEALSDPALPKLDAVPAPARRPVRSWWSVLTGIYFLGVCVLLARLIVGTIRAQILVRRAVNREGRLTSGSCSAPVTVGWLTPTVILPECWPRWPQAQLAAVLTHEDEHARRRDPLVQWLALLNRAVFWFHPLAWWLERRLSALAEEACDAAVLARGCDPFEYSEYLLEIARAVLRTGVRVNALGMAMPGSFLPQRIRRILEGRPAQRISRTRMACVGLGCALASAVFTAGAVDRRIAEVKVEAPAAIVQKSAVKPASAPAPVVPTYDRHPTPAARPVLLAQVQTAPVQPPALLYNQRRLLVLYFDLRAMPVIERERAFASAQSFVRTKMQSGDVVAIMTAGDDVKIRQDFTGDRDRLLQTLDRLATDAGQEENGTVDADRQLAGLQTAVNMLESLKQKKALIYFSIPSAGTATVGTLRSLIDSAIRANVAFYAIDARGPMPVGAALAPKGYIIGPEDVLQIQVTGQEGISGTYAVRPDGMVSVVLAGNIMAAGLTTSQLEAAISDRFDATGIISHPAVTVGVAAVHGPIKQNQ